MLVLFLSLLSLAAGQTTAGGTPTCTATTCKASTALSACTPGQSPVDPTSPCNCPLCIPPPCYACPAVTTVCAAGTAPRTCNDCTNSTCCPSCVPPPCAVCSGAVLGVCGTGAALTTSCATCPTCRPNCSTAMINCVVPATAPFCDGTNAGTGCCPTCRPPPPCALTALATCKSTLAGMAVCPNAAAFAFNTSSCCFNCKPPPPPSPCVGGLPTAALVQVLRECLPGEIPIDFPGQCTHSCRRPGSQCDPAAIVDRSTIPVCAAGVDPAVIGCVPTCIPPPPVCNVMCVAGQRCIRDPAAGPVCVPNDVCITFHAKGIDPTADPTDVMKLIVQKHCEDVTLGVNCAAFAIRIIDSIVCTRLGTNTAANGNTYEDIKCCIAEDILPPASAGRRLLAGSNGVTNDATNNPGATGNVSFYTASPNSATAASAVLALSTLLALFI